MDQGPNASPLGRFNQPPFKNEPDIEVKALGHGVERDHLVLRDCAKVQGRLDFYTQKFVPGLSHRREGVHLEIRKVTRRWIAFPHALALNELPNKGFIVYVRK